MRYLLILAAGSAILSFAWARRYFFVKTSASSRYRKGLGPFGTLFSLAVLLSLIASPGVGEGGGAMLSLFFFVASLALFWSAVVAFKSQRPLIAFSIGGPAALVTRGPYRVIRHPFYVSYTLYWIGGAVGAPNWLTIPAVTIMLYLYARAAHAEEEEITQSPLARSYEDYKRRAGMFLPRLKRRM
jgi:protein-S-isoprenylcysteine O-methyltransferase Ste14